MSQTSVQTQDTFATLLELAANNDIETFTQSIKSDPSRIDEIGLWYSRQKGSKQMVLEHRTPLMVAAMYGSLDVLKLILSRSKNDVNRLCGVDKTSALHCAASGGSFNAVEIVKTLLLAGADPNLIDVNGFRPVDVIVVYPKFPDTEKILEEILGCDCEITVSPLLESDSLKFMDNKKILEEVLGNEDGKIAVSPLLESDSPKFPNTKKILEDVYGLDEGETISPLLESDSPEFSNTKKILEDVLGSDDGEITISPLLESESPKFPDMKKILENVLGFDDGEVTVSPLLESDSPKGLTFNDTKREYPVDPSLPDIKNGIYSTDEFRMYSFKVRPCSRAYSHDWTECPFVHPGENARRRDPRKFHYSCVPCPDFRKSTCRRGDMCEYAHGVFECWLHPAQYRTRLCKDGSGCNRRVCFFAHKQDELRPLFGSPGVFSSFTPPVSPNANNMSNLNWAMPSRLRSSLNARDMQSDQDLNIQILNELSRQQKTILLPNDVFATENSSPRFSDQNFFSPRHNSSVFNPFQQQQNMLSPINTNFSPKSTSFSPRSVDRVNPISPMSARVSMLARENQLQFRSLSAREFGSRPGSVNGSDVDPWSNLVYGEEPDLSWVQSLVKETPQQN